MFELINGLRSIVENCMHVKPGESVLVVTDNGAEAMWIGQLTANVISSLGAEAIQTIIIPGDIADVEPPAAVAAAMKSVDALIFISDKLEAGHTDANQAARAAGVRCYVINNIPVDDLKKVVSPADLQLIKERTESLAARLAQANVARVTSPSGTSLTMGVTGRGALAAYPSSRGDMGVLPDYAEAATAPVEGTAEGIIVADLAVLQWNYVLREPLRYTVREGRVVDVSGSAEDTERMRKMLSIDENANNIAELGIGTSHIIPWVMRGTRRDAGRIGTAHIGMGRNNDIGGNTFSRIHFDSLISQATVELDGHRVLEGGKLFV
jgi:leucyl aminopeptidase (aminopeptidase T)